MEQKEMQNRFDFELVSPEAELMRAPAWQVVIPGEEGHFGVRAGHAALMASIQPGVISIWEKEDGTPRRIFITGGFADVTAENCTVLAEQAVNVEDLDQAEIERDIQNLNEDLRLAQSDVDKTRIEAGLAVAAGKLNALTGRAG